MKRILNFSDRVYRLDPAVLAIAFLCLPVIGVADVRVGVFKADVSPPIGSPLAYNRCQAIGMPLSARGIVLTGAGDPIVLCAVDWIGISNEGHDFWRQSLADAAGTSKSRVTVHTLHQHDAPRCDFSVERLMEPLGLDGLMFDPEFARRAVARVSQAAAQAKRDAMAAGALGISISGAGPSVFALCEGEETARRVGEEVSRVFTEAPIRSQVYVSRINPRGVYVVD